MDILPLLQANWNRVLEQYRKNIENVISLQQVFIEDILPSVSEELGLDAEAAAWATEWLQDTPCIFHILRRNNFTKSAAMESIRKILIWRYDNLWPRPLWSSSTRLRCFPPDVRDPMGRPILLVEVATFTETSDVYQKSILGAIERLRVHLKALNANSNLDTPCLQYVVLLDLKEVSLQSIVELVTWLTSDVMPRFPGLLAAVFMINYSWAHSRIWGVVKRILPAPAVSRVFFPTQQELLDYFSPSSLPREFGGSLRPLQELDDPLYSDQILPVPTPLPFARSSPSKSKLRPSRIRIEETPRPNADAPPSPGISHARQRSPTTLVTTAKRLSSTSISNPFFGYPARILSGSASPTPKLELRHGRRRKRDLLRTLLILFWSRWKHRIVAIFLCTVALIVSMQLAKVRRLERVVRRELASWIRIRSNR